MDPLTIALIGGALTGGSSLANMFGHNQVAEARAQSLAAERQRQAAYDAENQVFNTNSQNRYVNFGGQQTKTGKQLGDYFAAPSTPNPAVPQFNLPGASSPLINGEITKQMNRSHAFGDQQSHALGDLRSFGETLGGIGRLQAQDSNKIGQINDFKKGSAGVEQYELDAANQAGNKAKMFGDILGGLGKIGLTAGLSGGMPGLSGMFAPNPTTIAMTANPLWGGGANGTNAQGWY